LDYRDIGYVLACVEGVPSVTNPTTGVYQHVFESKLFSSDTIQSYTIEAIGASGDRARKANGCVFAGYKIETDAEKTPQFSATGWGKKLQHNITPSVGSNPVFVITINGAPTGGTFSVLFDNAPVSLGYNSTASAFQTALRALNGRFTSATVTGSTGGPYTVTAATDGLPMQAPSFIYSTLTGGTSPTVTLAITNPGGMKMQPSNVAMTGQVSLAFASSLVALDNSATIAVNEFKTAYDVPDRLDPIYYQNSSGTQDPGGVQEKKAGDHKPMLNMTLVYDSNVDTLIANSQSDTASYFRLKIAGGVIASSAYNYSVIVDVFGIPTWKECKDEQGNVYAVDLDVEVVTDLTGMFFRRVTVINDVADYTAA
jgi:hypothetical protein